MGSRQMDIMDQAATLYSTCHYSKPWQQIQSNKSGDVEVVSSLSSLSHLHIPIDYHDLPCKKCTTVSFWHHLLDDQGTIQIHGMLLAAIYFKLKQKSISLRINLNSCPQQGVYQIRQPAKD
jgi:hypothetical protein